MVIIYGKPDCSLCAKAKEKLNLLKIPFTFVDVATLDGWRDDGRVDFITEKTLREGDGKPELPLIRIEEQWCNYPEAMKCLRPDTRDGA